MRPYFLVFALLLMVSRQKLLSQPATNKLIDSLQQQLSIAKEDSSRILLLSSLSFEHHGVNPLKGIALGQEAANLAETINWKLGKAKAFNSIATNYNVKSDYLKALDYYLMALKIYEELKDTSSIASILANTGVNLMDRKDYKKAGENFYKALGFAKTIRDEELVSTVLSNMGALFYKQNKFDSALVCINQSQEINMRLSDKESVAINYNNLASIYTQMGDSATALSYFKKGISLFEELGIKRGVAANLMGIGELYQGIFEKNTTSPQTANSPALKEYLILAEKKYNEALSISKSIEDIHSVSELYERLSQIQSSLGNTEKAFENYKLHIVFKDSVLNQKNAEKIIQLQMKYDFEKAEAEAKFKAEMEKAAEERRNYLQIAGIIVFVLCLTSILLLLRKKKIKPVFLKLLGTFSLIVVFEFISLLLHPHIIHLTHHNLIFTLLCLVLLASIIIPTHHKIEHWMHEKLVKHHLLEARPENDQESVQTKG